LNIQFFNTKYQYSICQGEDLQVIFNWKDLATMHQVLNLSGSRKK